MLLLLLGPTLGCEQGSDDAELEALRAEVAALNDRLSAIEQDTSLEDRVSALEQMPSFEDLDERVDGLEARVSQLESSPAPSFREYNTGDHSELVSSVPPNNAKVVIYSLELADLRTGEILVALGEAEATNDEGVNVRFTSQLILGDSAGATAGDEISENNAFNISPNMHHGVATKVGTYVVDQDATTAYVNFVAWSNQGLTIVEQDYGRLSVIRITP